MTEGRRPARVAERVRDNLAAALQRDISDPRLVRVGITRVEVPPDLSVAIVYVRNFIGDSDSPTARNEVLRALQRAAGRLRRGLGTSLDVRRLPELRFEYDSGPDASRRIEELLQEIHAEKKPPQGSE